MAIPPVPSNTASTARVIAPAAEPSAQAGNGFQLDANHRAAPFTLYVMRDRLECHLGSFVAPLLVATHEPGINGNADDPTGTGAKMACQATGAIQIPDNFEVVAFGQPGTGHAVSYRRRWEQVNARGELVHVHYSDAWHRPRMLGTTTRWDLDLEGYHKFLSDVTRWAHGGELDDVLVAEAAERMISQIREQSTRSGGMSEIHLRVLLGHLPDSHSPPDIIALRARLLPSDAAPASETRRKPKADAQPTA